MTISSLDKLLKEVRACRVCAENLPFGPRPIVRASAAARILIVGQAPGARVHASGIPWDDVSGKRLRMWLGVDDATFYDEAKFAITPIGFCYPGTGPNGDKPPRPECAPLWLDRLRKEMPKIELTLMIGQYAQRHCLGESGKATLTETVAAWRDYAPAVVPLPHPSPRNLAWFKRNPWFDGEMLPMLRARIGNALNGGNMPAAKHKQKHPKIDIRRVYEDPSGEGENGAAYRVLVDRLWPRGLSKETLKFDQWARELAPSTELRKWFGHEPERWDMFRERYLAELGEEEQLQQMRQLLSAANGKTVTLLYGAKDEQHNQAVVLREAMSKLA